MAAFAATEKTKDFRDVRASLYVISIVTRSFLQDIHKNLIVRTILIVTTYSFDASKCEYLLFCRREFRQDLIAQFFDC